MSNNCSYIHASQNHFRYIQVARILFYLWNLVGTFVLICHPHNPKYVIHFFADGNVRAQHALIASSIVPQDFFITGEVLERVVVAVS